MQFHIAVLGGRLTAGFHRVLKIQILIECLLDRASL